MVLHLNLLPKVERKKIKNEAIYRLLRQELIFVLFLVIALGAATFFVKVNIERNMAAIDLSLGESKEKNVGLIVQVSELNGRVEHLRGIQDEFILQSRVLTQFAEIVPPGLVFTEFEISANKSVRIRGTYDTRDTIALFKERVEKSFLVDVEFPISNWQPKEGETNGEFKIQGRLSPEVIAQGQL